MKGRWTLIALVVSLALNLFLVGLGVGAVVFGHKARFEDAPRGAQQPRRGALWVAGRSLSEAHRPAYRAMIRKALTESRPDLVEARRLKRRAFEAMGQDTVAAATVAADLDAARTLEFKARARVERDLAVFAATLPPAERAALSDALGATTFRPGGGGERPRP
jgi:uncharacterized membrane protein